MDQSSFLLFRDAAAPADCSRPHHILGKSLAFHLELRFSSSCRGELRTRWPPAQKGPGNCWGPSSPGRGTSSRAPSTWRPDYGLTSTPWPLNVPSSALLKYPSPPLYPLEHPGWSPGASALAKQMSLLHVPSAPWIHPTEHDSLGAQSSAGVLAASQPASSGRAGTRPQSPSVVGGRLKR